MLCNECAKRDFKNLDPPTHVSAHPLSLMFNYGQNVQEHAERLCRMDRPDPRQPVEGHKDLDIPPHGRGRNRLAEWEFSSSSMTGAVPLQLRRFKSLHLRNGFYIQAGKDIRINHSSDFGRALDVHGFPAPQRRYTGQPPVPHQFFSWLYRVSCG